MRARHLSKMIAIGIFAFTLAIQSLPARATAAAPSVYSANLLFEPVSLTKPEKLLLRWSGRSKKEKGVSKSELLWQVRLSNWSKANRAVELELELRDANRFSLATAVKTGTVFPSSKTGQTSISGAVWIDDSVRRCIVGNETAMVFSVTYAAPEPEDKVATLPDSGVDADNQHDSASSTDNDSAEQPPTVDPSTITDICRAVELGQFLRVSELLEGGASPDARDQYSFTCLMLAAISGNYPIANLLISKGGHVNTETRGGTTALWLAKENKHPDIVSLLREHGAK